MSFELPDLDTVPAAQLLNELVARIPRIAPMWTEQNSSDPGITLLEMLVWIVEATAYQANCIPFEAYRSKVRFILGLASSDEKTRPYTQPSLQGLDSPYAQLQRALRAAERDGEADFHALRRAVFDFRSNPYLACTQSDIEALAMEANGYIASIEAIDGKDPASRLRVLRAHANYVDGMVDLALLVGDPSIDFAEYETQLEKNEAFGFVKKIKHLPLQGDGDVGPVEEIVDEVRRYVAPRSLLGNPISIRGAHLKLVDVLCTVCCTPRANTSDVAEGIAQAILNWMQPYTPKVRANALSFGAAPTKAALLSVFANVSGIYAVEGLDIEDVATQKTTGGGAGHGIGPQHIVHFKGLKIGTDGVTVLRAVHVTARAFSS